MPVVTVQKAIAAGATESLLTGTQVEFMSHNAALEIALNTTAVGVVATVTSGSDILMEESPIFVVAAGTAPKYPDDFTLTDVAAAGERVVVKCRNTTAGSLTVTCQVRATPI